MICPQINRFRTPILYKTILASHLISSTRFAALLLRPTNWWCCLYLVSSFLRIRICLFFHNCRRDKKNNDVFSESNDWVGTWGKHMKSMCFKTLREQQKLNHFPGTFQIGRKDRLWKNLQRLIMKYGQHEFGFIPTSYILPQDVRVLRQVWEKGNDEKWIVKPVNTNLCVLSEKFDKRESQFHLLKTVSWKKIKVYLKLKNLFFWNWRKN